MGVYERLADMRNSPFLQFVSNTADFDKQIQQYVSTGYAQLKYGRQSSEMWTILMGICRYQNLLGCSNLDLTNTTNLYARYTTTFLCNAIVQNSVRPCGLSGVSARPACADTCVRQVPQNIA